MVSIFTSEKLYEHIHSKGTKMLYVFLPTCAACTAADDVIKSCNLTTDLLVDNLFKCNKDDVHEFCTDSGVENVPALILYDDSGLEISRLNHAPSKEHYVQWLVNSLAD